MSFINTLRLKAARERLGLSQVELSKRFKVAKGVYGEWERGGKTPTVENLVAICKELDTTPNWLLGFETDETGSAAAGKLATAARATSAEALLANPATPPGLRELADSRTHQAAFGIAGAEWAALASLELDGGLTREGYVALLVLLRATAMHKTYPHPDAEPMGFIGDRPDAPASGASDTPRAVHEPKKPKYPPK